MQDVVFNHYVSPGLAEEPRGSSKGQGVYAQKAIPKGSVLIVWGGRVVDRAQIDRMSSLERTHSLQIDEDLYLAPDGPLQLADLVNHSCDPNAGLASQVTLVALRDIQAGEEICYDYAMSDGSDYDQFECRCGTAHCRGLVTGRDWSRPDLQSRYAGHFSPYLQRRIDAVGAAKNMPSTR